MSTTTTTLTTIATITVVRITTFTWCGGGGGVTSIVATIWSTVSGVYGGVHNTTVYSGAIVLGTWRWRSSSRGGGGSAGGGSAAFDVCWEYHDEVVVARVGTMTCEKGKGG